MNLYIRIGDRVNKSRKRSVRKTVEGRGDIKRREETKPARTSTALKIAMLQRHI
jgi:hypothetical protein